MAIGAFSVRPEAAGGDVRQPRCHRRRRYRCARGPARGHRGECRPAAAAAPLSSWSRIAAAPGKSQLHLAALADGPGEAGFDRRGGFVDVVAVQAKPGFQPQRIAGAQAGGHDLGLLRAAGRPGSPPCRAGPRFRSRPRRYSRSGTPGMPRRPPPPRDAHERQRGCLRREAGHDRRRCGPLQGQQRAVLHRDASRRPAGWRRYA